MSRDPNIRDDEILTVEVVLSGLEMLRNRPAALSDLIDARLGVTRRTIVNMLQERGIEVADAVD